MAFGDQIVKGSFRFTKDGRRLYRKRYLVTDDDVERVDARIRIDYVIGLVLVVAGTSVARDVWGESWWWLPFPLMLAVGWILRFWITSGLPVVRVAEAELVPVDRLEWARKTGPRKLWLWFLVCTGLAVLGGVYALTGGGWSGWLLLAMMAYIAFLFIREIQLLRADGIGQHPVT